MIGRVNGKSAKLPARPPTAGELVQVRSRRWLVEEVVEPPAPGESAVVRLACAEDDSQGQTLSVFWDYEFDRRILADEGWTDLAARGFDSPRQFAAFLHTLRWHCVTATDPSLFQSPFRAGIRIDAYQMEPLRKALRLPRVNLFIADDTGLGKTIEAGLIARELLLRRKVNTMVVAAPPSVLEQWKGELEDRFGLLFEILDRAYLSRMRRERGFGINPWRTHSRFLVSHNLLIDPGYADPLREWLGAMRPGSLLILDEAHHAAPASGGRYGIETKFTRAIRDLAGRFEHRLFLSATPHNGHSNSFSTLLELLDPYRFTRGVKVRGKGVLDDVMVRRLKEDIREVHGGFPRRNVEPMIIDGLLPDAPELVLSTLLDEYRTVRERRHENASNKVRAAAGLLVVGLQQRLLSSIEAFARSLVVHRRTVERHWAKADGAVETETTGPPDIGERDAALFVTPPDADDERGEWTGEESEAEESRQIEALTAAFETDRGPGAGAGSGSDDGADSGRSAGTYCRERILGSGLEGDGRAHLDGDTGAEPGRDIRSHPEGDAGAELSRDAVAALRAHEQMLLDRMQAVAEASRHRPDAKTRRLIDWIRQHQCPELPPFGEAPAGNPPAWNLRRVLIFTENREGTKRYLKNILEQAIEDTDHADERIEVIDGLTSGHRRKAIQRRFNADPAKDPLRILIATDAAREGLNFQAHCADLFHFDLPWNPGRIEQRNGRIDRKLQPAAEVNCHYFVLPQRAEDRVLEVLVRKTETIRRELGSLSKVIDDNVEHRLRGGIRHEDADALRDAIRAMDLDDGRKRATSEELESARERRKDLLRQIDRCQTLLERSRKWAKFDAVPFREALSCSLELLGAPPLGEGRDEDGRTIRTFPALDRRAATDASWAATLDTLREPRKTDQKLADWRRDAPIRPVIFEDSGMLGEDTVHLHLEQRVAQRLLARFRAQGFIHHDLSRACLAQTRDSVPRVVLLGRLSLYGRRAERLHEELVSITARWTEPALRREPLRAYAREAETRSLALLEESLGGGGSAPDEIVQRRLLDAAPRDIKELLHHLEPRAKESARAAAEALIERGERESKLLQETLERQRGRVMEEIERHRREFRQIAMDFGDDRDARQQLEANMRHWERRLEQFDADIEQEPERIRRFYDIQRTRVEPVGLVYLWPESN